MLAPLRIPIWRESSVALEHAALRRSAVLRGDGVARGDGAPVLLIPGFMAGDPSLATMARWLSRMGHRPLRAGLRLNVGCTTSVIDRLEEELAAHAARHGRKVTIVGQSRGGIMGRVLAVRRPDLVERVVCLGSPLTDQLKVHPVVRAQVTAVGLLGTLRVPGLFRYGCGWGACCETSREQATGAFPRGVELVSVYSKRDGIVDWRACLDPAARHVEVDASHLGMGLNAQVYEVVARTLAPRRHARARARPVAA